LVLNAARAARSGRDGLFWYYRRNKRTNRSMPRLPKFAIVQTPKGWRVRVPKSISDTKRPQSRFFPSRRKAEDFAGEIRNNFRNHGKSSTVLPPRVADDALRAWQILEPYGITLTHAAMKAAKDADAISRSSPADEALDAWLAAVSNLAAVTMKSYKATAEILRNKLGDTILATVDPSDIQSAITGKSYNLHRRNTSAF